MSEQTRQGGGMVRALVALGANLGDRRGAIERAAAMLGELPGTRLIALSSLYETEPLTLPGSPPQPAYINAAAAIETTLAPRDLLAGMLEIERRLGRERSGEARWAARTIDLDLILYDEEVIDEPGLTVPHPRMHERLFVLTPLAEIARDARHPILEKTVEELWKELVSEGGR